MRQINFGYHLNANFIYRYYLFSLLFLLIFILIFSFYSSSPLLFTSKFTFQKKLLWDTRIPKRQDKKWEREKEKFRRSKQGKRELIIIFITFSLSSYFLLLLSLYPLTLSFSRVLINQTSHLFSFVLPFFLCHLKALSFLFNFHFHFFTRYFLSPLFLFRHSLSLNLVSLALLFLLSLYLSLSLPLIFLLPVLILIAEGSPERSNYYCPFLRF